MEKTLSPDERIRRAEEIYYQRRVQVGAGHSARHNSARVPVGAGFHARPNTSLLKKMLFQIAVCVVLYFILYTVQTTNYIFSKDVIGKTKETLSYDINFQNLYNQVINSINGIIPKKQDTAPVQNNEVENTTENTTENTVNNSARAGTETCYYNLMQ